MLISLTNRMIEVEDPSSGERNSLLLELEDNGTVVITDAESDIPRFIKRVKMTKFPTDALICAEISRVLGGKRVLVSSRETSLELDSSALAGLKKMPVDIFDNVYLDEVKSDALILCVDIRNFSDFLCMNKEETVFKLIKDFTSNFLSCVNQFGYGCSYYKLMGDGAFIIWDSLNAQSVSEALLIFDTYVDFVNEELFKPYEGLALAGALVTEKVFKYEISAETSQLKYRDYIGYGINLVCRLQTLARKDQLVINHALARSGLVPYETTKSSDYLGDLHLLKGLREEDCDEVLFYKSER